MGPAARTKYWLMVSITKQNWGSSWIVIPNSDGNQRMLRTSVQMTGHQFKEYRFIYYLSFCALVFPSLFIVMHLDCLHMQNYVYRCIRICNIWIYFLEGLQLTTYNCSFCPVFCLGFGRTAGCNGPSLWAELRSEKQPIPPCGHVDMSNLRHV